MDVSNFSKLRHKKLTNLRLFIIMTFPVLVYMLLICNAYIRIIMLCMGIIVYSIVFMMIRYVKGIAYVLRIIPDQDNNNKWKVALYIGGDKLIGYSTNSFNSYKIAERWMIEYGTKVIKEMNQ